MKPKDKPFIGLLALAATCAGLAVLACLLVAGTLALSKILASNAAPEAGGSPTPLYSETPTPLRIVPPTRTRRPTRTALPPTETPLPSPTFVELSLEASAVAPQGSWCVPWNSPSVKAQVEKVIDGITFEASFGGQVRQVRYIGLDLPEYSNDPAVWTAMTEKNKSLVEGRQVLLIQDVADSDQGDELLRYVLADGVFVNQALVESGYAIASSTPPFTACDAILIQAEKDAISHGRGLWAPTPVPTRTMIPPTPTVSAFGEVVVINIAKQGSGWQEADEFVEIFNAGVAPVQLAGWTVSDDQNHIFRFPQFVLGAGQYCRVYTDEYHPDHCGFNFHNPSQIWDNYGDCATLKDKTGKLVDKFCYY